MKKEYCDILISGILNVSGNIDSSGSISASSLFYNSQDTDERYALSGIFGAASIAFEDLTDVMGPYSSGQFIKYDGTNFLPYNAPLGSGEVDTRVDTYASGLLETTNTSKYDFTSGLLAASVGSEVTVQIEGWENLISTSLPLTSGDMLIFDGTNHVPISSGVFIGREELLQQYSLELDEAAGSITYIGEALPGTATAASSWRIKRLDESGNPELIITWADGNDNFDNIWDNRAALSYL